MMVASLLKYEVFSLLSDQASPASYKLRSRMARRLAAAPTWRLVLLIGWTVFAALQSVERGNLVGVIIFGLVLALNVATILLIIALKGRGRRS